MAYTNIDDPSAYFQIDLYTGTGSSLANTFDGNSVICNLTGFGLKKEVEQQTILYMTLARGVHEQLESNTTTCRSHQMLQAFNSFWVLMVLQ
jgi:hypothetical protein